MGKSRKNDKGKILTADTCGGNSGPDLDEEKAQQIVQSIEELCQIAYKYMKEVMKHEDI